MQTKGNATAVLRKFHSVRNQVPNDLLQSICISRYYEGRRIKFHVDPDAFCVRGRTHRIYGGFNHRREFNWVQLKKEITGNNPRHVQYVVDNSCLGLSVTPDAFNGLVCHLIVEGAFLE